MTTNVERLVSPRPGSFWRLVFHSNFPDLRHVGDYEVDWAVFNYIDFKRGKRYTGDFPIKVRLIAEAGAGPFADHLGNPMGLTIMSTRLVDYLRPMIGDSVQLLPAPVYELSGSEVNGFWIVNVLRVVDCLDRKRTPKDLRRRAPTDAYIDAHLASGVHMFKYLDLSGKPDSGVTCSYELVTSLKGKGFTGLAFIPYELPDPD